MNVNGFHNAALQTVSKSLSGNEGALSFLFTFSIICLTMKKASAIPFPGQNPY